MELYLPLFATAGRAWCYAIIIPPGEQARRSLAGGWIDRTERGHAAFVTVERCKYRCGNTLVACDI